MGLYPAGLLRSRRAPRRTAGMKRLVKRLPRPEDRCHRGCGVRAHASEFPYLLVYNTSGEPNPMMGRFAGEFFADWPGTDYRQQFNPRLFLRAEPLLAARISRRRLSLRLRARHVRRSDGPGLRGSRVSHVSRLSVAAPLSDASGRSRIIQCAEHLPDPAGSLRRRIRIAHGRTGSFDRAREVVTRRTGDRSARPSARPAVSWLPAGAQRGR
jgi:hypothetical protein